MIKKQFRLREREVKKVLQKGKPFFSYGLVLNKIINKLGHNRFAIVIGSKSVNTNVERNYFRRRFYDMVLDLKTDTSYDLVFVVKKKTKLNKKDDKSFGDLKKDIKFLINKI